MASLLESLVSSIKVRSAYGPDFDLSDPFAPGPPSPFLQALKPEIQIGIKGSSPIVIAPYGHPPPTRWPLVVVVLTLGAGVSVGLLGVGALSILRGKPRRMKGATP